MPELPCASWPLPRWLEYIEGQHPVAWDLGLARVGAVADAMGLRVPAPLLVTVGGTNGKGSTTTAIEQLFLSLGLKVGATLSPHLFAFNERIRLGGCDVDDGLLCAAFAAIETARGATTLTYFEYGMLAAFWCFRHAQVDVAVVEVGLGGRLDASNLADADVAVVTSVGIDHTDYLGPDRETIGAEKVAICRADRPLIVGEQLPPDSVVSGAAARGARLSLRDRDFTIAVTAEGFHFTCGKYAVDCAVRPRLALDNVAAALAAVLAAGHVPTATQVETALARAFLPGRLQRLAARVPVVVDVAHNPHGAAFLAQALLAAPATHTGGVTRCVLGTLADKDAVGIIGALAGAVGHWYCATTTGPRGRSGASLQAIVTSNFPGVGCAAFADLPDALGAALAEAGAADGVLVCGSFQVAGEALRHLGAGR